MKGKIENMLEDFLNVAISQIGYSEGKNNKTKYRKFDTFYISTLTVNYNPDKSHKICLHP